MRPSVLRRMESAELNMIRLSAPKLTNDVSRHGFRAPLVAPLAAPKPCTATIAEIIASKGVN